MHGRGSTGARCAALVVAVLMTASGCGNGPAEPALDATAVAQGGPSVADLPPGLLDELADQAAGALPAVADRLPAAEAEAVGRRGVPGAAGLAGGPGLAGGSGLSGGSGPSGGPVEAQHAPPSVDVALPHPIAPRSGDSSTTTLGNGEAVPGGPVPMNPSDAAQPAEVPPDANAFLGQRVLAAVLPALDGAPLDAPAELVPFVRAARLPDGNYATAEFSGQDPTSLATDRLRQFGPETIPWVTAITGALADHDGVAPLLRVGAGTEPEIVTAHGRAHLALAVVVSRIVVPAADVQLAGSGPDVVVGAALEAATQVLGARPMPDTYAAAQLERRRAEYAVPNYASGDVPVPGHRFGLLEGPLPAEAGEPANGLVTAVPGGLVVRTGADGGPVPVTVRVLPGPPPDDEVARSELRTWHEVVEVGFTAEAGAASVVSGAGPGVDGLLERTPPRPGPMRARVAARGRDDGDGERYEIVLWAAPLAPERVVKATDRLGHRLRGEPEPPVVVRPESAYRWLRDSSLSQGGTVTVVTGSTVEQVITAFGGDPARPVPVDDGLLAGLDPWVAVLPVDGAVLAVEPNGWQGSHDAVLRAASARGRAASMYRNVDAMTNLAFARDGEVLDSYEPMFTHTATDAEVRAALDGIDWEDYTDLHEKGLVAVERFTGRGIRAQDLDRIEAAATAYRIPESG